MPLYSVLRKRNRENPLITDSFNDMGARVRCKAHSHDTNRNAGNLSRNFENHEIDRKSVFSYKGISEKPVTELVLKPSKDFGECPDPVFGIGTDDFGQVLRCNLAPICTNSTGISGNPVYACDVQPPRGRRSTYIPLG